MTLDLDLPEPRDISRGDAHPVTRYEMPGPEGETCGTCWWAVGPSHLGGREVASRYLYWVLCHWQPWRPVSLGVASDLPACVRWRDREAEAVVASLGAL